MKLKKEFANFYTEIRIDNETDTLIEKRTTLEKEIKDKFPQKLADHGIELNKSDIHMIDQGSYKYNTTIKSDVVDRDVAVMIPLNIEENNDPRKIKQYLKEVIDIPARTVEIKEPCIRAAYYEDGEEWLHIDLPLYVKNNDQVFLARGKSTSENYVWENADPDGLNDYLCHAINGNTQLRRVICYLKKWKNEAYAKAKSDHEVPPSIGLTLLACAHFVAQTEDGADDDLLALQKTASAIKNLFSCQIDENGNVTAADISCNLPVKPYTDVFSKMRAASTSYMLTFYKRLKEAVENLETAVHSESEHDAGVYVQKVLGEDFEVPEKRNQDALAATAYIAKKEHSFG